MTPGQIIGPVRIAIAWVLSWAITAGYIPSSWGSYAPDIAAIIVLALLVVWSFIDHSTVALLDKITKSDEVKEVVVDPHLAIKADNPKVVTTEATSL